MLLKGIIIVISLVVFKDNSIVVFFRKRGRERVEGFFFHNMYIYYSPEIFPLILPEILPLFAQATLGERELFSLFVMSSLCQSCFNGVNNGVDIIFYIAFDCKCCN